MSSLRQYEQKTPTNLQFTPESLAEIAKHRKKYPDRGAALLPTLYVAQAQFGFISPEVMALVAKTLDLPETRVREVATWYTMFHKKPIGRYNVQVCSNISCHLCGADALVEALKTHLGIKVGETTKDGKFTLSEVECLASCGSAPCMQVNMTYHEHLTAEKAIQILKNLP
ncbi:MAG: NADH-quinone oxidoreductase subunit NuoE [Myxococcota bacterium]